ncbi:EAL domain-containing protein (putative c-di-GMP-specific phosphodiesterase class I) [Rhizobium sp. BK196]|nr:EAL domain-containing protein (putative c-di-GMP-specific phosphodiesterase class I) [Rhizobium sp. BK196]
MRSIIEIGRSLNILVTAEGVETADHVRILQELGCDMLQGYALARPMSGLQLPAFIRGESWRQPEGEARALKANLRHSMGHPVSKTASR